MGYDSKINEHHSAVYLDFQKQWTKLENRDEDFSENAAHYCGR
ncbi:MAG: hypothetical protein RJA81_444 [Planctomycetota bacterium]